MKKSNRRRIISMLLVAFACVTTIVGAFLLMQKPRLKAVVTNGQTMFATDGSYSSSLVGQLTALAANAGKNTIGVTQCSDAGQIRAANGGAVPEVKLFETDGVISSTRRSFTEQQWRLVYITNSSGGVPVFTFLMAGAYRDSIFAAAPTHYNTSVIRTNLTNDFAEVLNNFEGASRYIVTPANLPGAWQSNQSDNSWHGDNSLIGAALNDKIWLPSTYELDIDSTFWNLTSVEHSYAQNGFSDEAWLRSSNGGNENYGVSVPTGSNIAWYPALTENHAVRPAIHISFPPLVTDNDPLFISDGNHNIALAEQLRTLAEVADKNGISYVDIGYFEISDAEQIRNANGGSLPEILLFESARQHSRDFTERSWRLVNISHGGMAPVFTFMMTEAYRDDEFHYVSENYETSVVRANLTYDFDNILGYFSDASDYIVTPRNLPGVQSNNFEGAADDLIWIPSIEELGSSWNLTQAERGYGPNGFSLSAWTRSASENQGWVRTVSTSGTFSDDVIDNVNAVRPAIHITLPLNCPTCDGLPCICPNDVVAVRTFLLQKQSGVTNAEKLGVDAYDPGTWVNNFKFNGSNRLTHVGNINGPLVSNLSAGLHGKVEFRNCVALEDIYLGGNHFNQIDVSTNTSLATLVVGGNFSNIDTTNNPSLAVLSVSGTFHALDVSNNHMLTTLFVSSPNLYSLDLSNNIDLTELIVNNTNISDLNLEYNLMLTYLDISNNNLNYLNLWNNADLTYVNISNNAIDYVVMPRHGFPQTFEAYGNPLLASFIGTIRDYVHDDLHSLEYFSYSYSDETVSAEINRDGLCVHAEVFIDIMPYYFSVDISYYGASMHNITVSLGGEASVLRQATGQIDYQMSGSDINSFFTSEETLDINNISHLGLWTHAQTPMIYNAKFNVMYLSDTYLTLTLCDDPCTDPSCPIHGTPEAWNPKLTHSVTNGVYYFHTFAAAADATAYSLVSGTIPNGLTFNPITRVLSGTPNGTPGLYTFTIRATIGGIDTDRVITVNVEPGSQRYIITESGNIFTAVIFDEDGTDYFLDAANSIQDVIHAIRSDANGNDCHVEFRGVYLAPGYYSSLDIGTQSVVFDGAWGTVTISGGITSANGSSGQAAVIIDNVTVISNADISNTAVAGSCIAVMLSYGGNFTMTGGAIDANASNGVAIYHNSTGDLIINGGDINAAGYEGEAIHSDSAGSIIIEEINGPITIFGTSTVSSTIYLSNGTANCDIISGTIINPNGKALVTHGHTVNIMGGVIRGGTYAVGIENYGVVDMSGGIVESENDGAFYINSAGITLDISGGQIIADTAIFYEEGGRYEQIILSGNPIINGRLEIRANTLTVLPGFNTQSRIYNLKIQSGLLDNAVAVNGGTGYLGSFNLVQTPGYVLVDDGTNLILKALPLTPATPTLSINTLGDIFTISSVSGGEYQWRLAGETAWNDLGSNNSTGIPTGITSGRTYQARVRIAANGDTPASDWSSVASLAHPTYTISYNRNGGFGIIANQTKYHGTGNPVTLSDGASFWRTGWYVSSWNTAADGKGTSFPKSGTYTANAALTLYAVWTRIPVDWSYTDNNIYNVTNGVAITPIVFPAATGGNGSFNYHLIGDLPNGLTFNAATRTISGTPNDIPKAYHSVAYAESLYESGGVLASRTVRFNVAFGTQTAPSAPTLSLNATGNTVTIAAISGGEYQWRYTGETAWNNLGTTNTFIVTTGITAGRTYEAQRRLAATSTHNASPWSATGSLAHTTYTIKYSNNGGAGIIQNQIKFHGTLNPVNLNDGANFSRAGWDLMGWSLSSGGPISYATGALYSANAELDLYAIWERTPITWSLANTEYHLTNGVEITPIILPAATGGNGTITYTVDNLPGGLTFNPSTRTISGTPNTAADTYQAIASAQSAYDDDIVNTYRILTFVVALYEQSVPSAPTLSLNAQGDIVTISAVSGGEYQWRYAGETAWIDLGTTNTFTVTTGITADRAYEARRRLAATETHAASGWSFVGSLEHPTYTITYNSNGGTGSIASQTKYHGTSNPIQLSGGGGFSRIGWDLKIWSTLADGTGATFPLGVYYGGSANLTLFAIWERIPITWSLESIEYNVTNGIAITEIVLPAATGGNGTITYLVDHLPVGLTFDPLTRTISGTPNDIPTIYHAAAYAESQYDAGSVFKSYILTFNVDAGTQTAPAAPTLSFGNSSGNTIVISPLEGGSGYEYRWRYSGEIIWNSSVSNVFTITTGISADRTYHGQVRLAATDTHLASPWSATGTLVHSSFTVTYNNNGGIGTIPNQIKYYGTLNPVTLNGGVNFSRVGWNLIGWNTNSAGTGTPYALNEQYSANLTLSLYAVWERVPIDWSLVNTDYNITNGVAITPIVLPEATGGNGTIVYELIDLPVGMGLTFNAGTRTISGTPNFIPGTYLVTATATSTYNGGDVSAVRLLKFILAPGLQVAPSAPTLSLTISGNAVTIYNLTGGEYQWRYLGESVWNDLGITNVFTVSTGITAGRTYQARQRFAATQTHSASDWSSVGSLAHPTYTITYSSNGGVGTIANQTKYHGTLNPVELSDGANFSRVGWHITRWNTASHGLGDSYNLGSLYTANAELNLFAVWSQNSVDWNPQQLHLVTNGVEYSHTFADAIEQFGDTNFTYTAFGGSPPIGMTVQVSIIARTLHGTPNAIPGDYSFTLRASINGVDIDRIITVRVSEGTQNQPTAPTLNINSQGYEVTISAISGGEYRWRYVGEITWNELGTINTFVVPSGGMAIGGTYEAQRRLAATPTHAASPWSNTGSLAHPEYTITYDNNGGTGTIANQIKYYGSMNIVVLDNGGNFSRAGWNLIGWNTEANGFGESYSLGLAYSANAVLTLYAVWERIPITWSLQDSLNDVTNGIPITNIILPAATGGNGDIVYTVTGLPNGLTFDAPSRTISGIPNDTAGTYNAIATATSTYNGGSVSTFRTITFAVSLANQGTPTAPTLTLNAAGNTVTISIVVGGEYQWRYLGDTLWIDLGVTNTINVSTGIISGRTYEARRRLAETETQSASDWSPVGSLAHPESTISYDSNGGTGIIPSQTKYYGTLNPIALSDGTGFSRPGWTLIEWRSETDGSGSAFPLGSTYTGSLGWTLYAVWERIPITWTLEDASYNVTNGTTISNITFPFATGGNGTVIYTVTGLPSGLAFNAATRTISGTPNDVPGMYNAIATAASTYDGGSVSAIRTITFVVALGTQTAPTAPTLALNASGNTATISNVAGGEYRWRYTGEATWNELGTVYTFTVTTGITAGRTYEAQRRLAATGTLAASGWSSIGTLAHPTYTITYSNNGGTGTIVNQTKFHGTLNPVTLSGGSDFSRPGWTLTGWNTNATGTGTSFALNVIYADNSGLNLFAVWSQNSITWNPQLSHATTYDSFYTHTFAAATEESGATDFVYSLVSGALPNGMTFNAATRVLSGTPNTTLGDYTFIIRATINGIDIDRVITVTVNAASQTAPTAPTLALNEIGNIVTIATVTGAEYRWRYSGEIIWTELGTNNTFIVTSGITSGRTYEAQRRLAATSTHEASPWSATGSLAHPTYIITYDNNEGTGTIANQTKYHGTSNPVNLNDGVNFSRIGWTLIGWNTAANGSGISYDLSASYAANTARTLFAVWERTPITWALVNTTYEVTRDVTITNIVFPAATGGNGTIVYTVTGLPTGLTFNAATRTVSGTPNAVAGTYNATATAASTYDGGTVSAVRILIFEVSLASQPAPTAPTLEINVSGDIVTISTVAGGEYQWRIAGSSTWVSLGATNAFNIPTGITSATVYEAQRRFAATGSLAESPWSPAGFTTHQTYTVSYNLNGGTGTISNQTKFHGTLNPVALCDDANVVRPGWTLTGWNTNAAGTGITYALGAQYTANAGISLFAVWVQNSMQWNPTLALPDGFGGFPYTRSLAPLASGIGQTFTYTLYSGSLGGLSLSTAGAITGTLNQVTVATTLQFVIAVTSSNGQYIVSGTFTLTVNTGTPTCPNPCTDPDCPIHGGLTPTLPGAKLKKDEDKITLVGIANPEIYTYSWSSKVGKGSYELISVGTTQTFVIFVQDETYKTTYRCQIYFGDELIKTLEYVINPPKGPSVFDNPVVTFGLFFIGTILFITFLIMLWIQRDRRKKSHLFIDSGGKEHHSGKSGLVGRCDNKPIIPGTGLVGCDKKPRKRRTGLIND